MHTGIIIIVFVCLSIHHLKKKQWIDRIFLKFSFWSGLSHRTDYVVNKLVDLDHTDEAAGNN